MELEWFESLPISGFYLAVIVIMMAFGEVGYQFGVRARSRQDDDAMASLGPMVGGLLAMTAFVLAFSFSMASSQNDQRKQDVLQESNNIGTAYLRADLLDQQYKIEVKNLLQEYVGIRLAAASGGDIDTMIAKSVDIHNRLWVQVTSAAKESPNTNTLLMIQSVNDVIDVHEKRLTDALRNRIPGIVWVALAAIIALTMITLGTHVGLTGKRRLVATIPLILAFAVLMMLVVDLNRPQSGLIKVGQQSMIDLQDSMGHEAQ